MVSSILQYVLWSGLVAFAFNFVVSLLYYFVVFVSDRYEACMDVTDSDHKPVRCKFNVRIAHADRSVRRQELGKIFRSNEKIRSILENLSYVPETIVSTNNIVLQHNESSILQVTNKCVNDTATYKIICEAQSTVKEDGDPDCRPKGGFGFPRWLEVLCSVLAFDWIELPLHTVNH